MTTHLRHLRPLLVGLVALLLTAGIAFAAQPEGNRALENASQHAGKTVPVQAQTEDEDGDEEEADENEAPEAPEAPEVEEDGDGGEHCATDPTTLTEEELDQLNHGAIVCWAAHQETPEGFDNHGAWVSSWAKQNHGHEEDASSDGTTETTAGSLGRGHGQGKGKGKTK